MNKFIKILFLIISTVTTSCRTTDIIHSNINSDGVMQCDNEGNCIAYGMMTMSSDGHGFIGVLRLSDDECINVSIPDNISKTMLGKPPVFKRIYGTQLRFIIPESGEFVRVGGRSVGIGLCGDRYIFVK